MEIILSKRLATVASFVPEGAALLDVGSDHAYLPIALANKGLLTHAVAGEVVEGPYQSAKEHVAMAGLIDVIAVRLANGLAAMEESDCLTTITICGMGGRLITTILEAGKEKLSKIKRLILQPNNREDELRIWLSTNGFAIVAESIVLENDKYYEIIVAEPGSQILSDNEQRFGPFLMAELSEHFVGKWQREREKWCQALSGIPETHQQERARIMAKLQRIEEVLDESK